MSIVQVVVSDADYAKLIASANGYRTICDVPGGARVLSGVEHRPERSEVVLFTYEISDGARGTISVETYRPMDWPEPSARVIGTTRK